MWFIVNHTILDAIIHVCISWNVDGVRKSIEVTDDSISSRLYAEVDNSTRYRSSDAEGSEAKGTCFLVPRV